MARNERCHACGAQRPTYPVKVGRGTTRLCINCCIIAGQNDRHAER